MRQTTALLFGGTGPTGPSIVRGLHARGYRVSIFHSGRHEVEFDVPVEHIHDDPHFKETIERGIGDRTFDLVIAQYGRLRAIAQVMQGRAGRIVAGGGSTALYAPSSDERWGKLGRPQLFSDATTIFRRDEGSNGMDKMRFRMVQALETFFTLHPQGTYAGYQTIYGPRNPAPHDWSIVRRILDGRKSFVIADGGIKLDSRLYGENGAHAVLAIVDNPAVAAGKRYTVVDENVYSVRQRVECIARHMGAELELVDMPYALAWPCHPYYRHYRGHRLTPSSLIRSELGYKDVRAADEALDETVDWLLANRPEPGGEAERQIGDPFDYAAEDALIARWKSGLDAIGPSGYDVRAPGHQYRHPKRPDEEWAPIGEGIVQKTE